MNHFSIVTVVRNDLAGLQKSRNSLEEQKYENWTHIIVDGASSDGSLEYLKSLPKENTIYISEPDSGIYDAMNKGWKMANPDSFVFYLNARDVFTDPSSLQNANLALSSSTTSNWGCTTHEEIDQNGEGWVCKLVSPPSVSNQLYAFGYRSHQAVLMKAAFISSLGGFDETYKIAADWDLIVRALRVESPIIWSHPLGKFELGGASSISLLEAHLELMKLRKKYLSNSLASRLFEQIWCAIYLRDFGYQNYLSKILNLIYPTFKINQKKKVIGKRKVMLLIQRRRHYSGKYPMLGKLFHLYFNVIYFIITYIWKVVAAVRIKFISMLHHVLHINAYDLNV